MSKIGELNLLPISKWEAYPTYYIGAGGIGYLIISWLMHYIDQYLPGNTGIQDFRGARFLTLDTAPPGSYDLPPSDPATNTLFRIEGNLNTIINEVTQGNYPGIREFYPPGEETEVARRARENVGDLIDGAGTTRPFGRIGFFSQYEKISNELLNLVRKDVGSQPMRFGGDFHIIPPERRCFFIVSSLAGGTGSSCFLDIAASLRKIHDDHFDHEKWSIIGVFTLAEVLAIDVKVDQEVKRTKMRANAYAALKELNHFLVGNPFMASYGVRGDVKVAVSNKREDDCLFDLVHLVDTPNQDKSPLSGRMEVAQFLAQSIMYLGCTKISKEFFERIVDSKANLYFDTLYPPSSGDGTEQQQFRFSTLGLCRLFLPTEKYIHYGHCRMALEAIDCLQNNVPTDITQEAKQIANRCCLNSEDFDREFNRCSGGLFAVSSNLIGDLRSAQNPMDEIRSQINRMVFNPKKVTENAGKISNEQIQRIFPEGGKGDLQKECDKLVDDGRSGDIFNILKIVEEQLNDYQVQLTNELRDAINQVGANTDSATLFQQSILSNRNITQTLDDMEQNWRGWGARLQPSYRNRFIHRYEGEINQAADLMKRMQRVAFIISVWDMKIKMVAELNVKVKELTAQYQSSYLQIVRQWILDEITRIERKSSAKSRFLQMAIGPEKYYDQLFSQLVGNKVSLLGQLVRKVQNGLSLDGKQNVRQSQWDNYQPKLIAGAIVNLVKDTVTPGFPVAADTPYQGAKDYYKIDLNHPYFLPAKEITDFNKSVLSEWKRKAQMSLLFDGSPPEAQRYVVSGCRTDSASDSWSNILNLSGLSPISGGTPNQAILLNLGLGFPLTNLSRVKVWFSQQYISQKRQGWPLHLFQEELIEMMTEPYLDWISLPDSSQAKELYKEAKELRILAEHESGEEIMTYWDKDLLRRLPAMIQNYFFDYLPKSETFDRGQLLELLLRKEPDLIKPLKESLIRYNPPTDEKNSWDERRKQITDGKTIEIETIVDWLIEANLLSKNDLDQLEFDTNFYHDYKGSDSKFCYSFFSRVPFQKRITQNEFIKGLASHQPLSRWITKKVLRALISPEKLNDTRRRYQEGGFPDYLRGALSAILPS